MTTSAVMPSRHEGYAVLTLAGDAWRSVDGAALAALEQACAALHDDMSVQAVIIEAGEGDWAGEWIADPGVDLSDAFLPLATLPQAVIAAVQGRVSGAGLELALHADIRIAADGATFALGEGLPRAGGLTRLHRAAGRRAATWLAVAGAAMTANEALQAGLVSAALPATRLPEEARRLAGVIAGRGPIAVRFAKEALREGPDLTLAQALRYEMDLTVILQATADRAEGVAAFVEKRPPRFSGR